MCVVTDLKVKLQLTTELRDSIDFLTQPQLYAYFLERLVYVLLKLLDGPPVFVSTSLDQVCRTSENPGAWVERDLAR